jgi:hypothetical protein
MVIISSLSMGSELVSCVSDVITLTQEKVAATETGQQKTRPGPWLSNAGFPAMAMTRRINQTGMFLTWL